MRKVCGVSLALHQHKCLYDERIFSLITRGRDAPQWCCSSASVRWTPRASLFITPPAAALAHRAAGHQSQIGYKVTVAARHQSRCGKHPNAERDSRRGFPRVRVLTELQRRQTRGKELTITSSFCGGCCCVHGLHAHICHVQCIERLQTRITDPADPTDPTDPTGCKQLLQNRNTSWTSSVFATTWGKSLCSVVGT